MTIEQEYARRAEYITAFVIAAAKDEQKYGSMLSSFFRDWIAGKLPDWDSKWAWILKYASDHWGFDILPKSQAATAEGPNSLRLGMIEAVSNYKGAATAKASIGSVTVPEVVDWLINFMRDFATGKEVQLAMVNFALTVALPALKAKAGLWAVLLAPVEVWLKNRKAELEAA